MTAIVGHAAAHEAFLAALTGGALHHAWLLAGPEGVGKATFARAAALRLLAAPGELGDGALDVRPDSQAARLFAHGSHPDYREMRRLPKDAEKPDQDLARSIPIAQVRALRPLLATKPSIGRHRVIVIDTADDLERPGASNALLKNLEEPPDATIFLLVSHQPGRLLPTIRSRCRLLRFEGLDAGDMERVLGNVLPETSADETATLIRAAEGSPGRAIRYAGLDLAGIDTALEGIARDGDAGNTRRLALSKALSLKAAQPRYEAFLDRAPTIIAQAAALRHGAELRSALDAYDAARALGGDARRLSLDTAGTVFEMGGIVARLAG